MDVRIMNFEKTCKKNLVVRFSKITKTSRSSFLATLSREGRRLLHCGELLEHIVEVGVSLDVFVGIAELILQLQLVLFNFLLEALFLLLLLGTQFLLFGLLLFLLRDSASGILLLLQFVHADDPGGDLWVLVDLSARHAGFLNSFLREMMSFLSFSSSSR